MLCTTTTHVEGRRVQHQGDGTRGLDGAGERGRIAPHVMAGVIDPGVERRYRGRRSRRRVN